ncbi:MAG: hypothetical protein CL797_08820 [Chromatiales bacterium]|nr:hypothetical protein [Chromatiales bacterium]
MAAGTAAAAILVLSDSAVFPADMFAFAFEITLVTGRAERRVLRRGVHKRAVDAIAVTAAAAGIVSVVARVIPLRIMAEEGRRPAHRDMTLVALDGRV